MKTTSLMNMTRDELQNTYFAETNERPDNRWKDLTLIDRIRSVRLKVAERARLEAEKAREAEIAEGQRQERICSRGAFETFTKEFVRSENKNERKLANAVRWAQGVISEHEKMTAELAKDFATNPGYTMSWGDKYFTHAAEYNVAISLKDMFEAGATVEAMFSNTMRFLMNKAKYPARSTSPASNLMEIAELAASTRLAEYLDMNESFY